ncbi:hypothetical protein [Defluviitalea phaphyphila]|uniref:hypothetical protein n=1 Tax=Defluviitalea phaphyphila TaxID=1473580 RepID=UPI0007302D8C|nr:hypothetical protein [Defluviitalea phaphyphila]
MSSTKIVVFKLKEVLYTSLFAIIGFILLLILIFQFIPHQKHTAAMYEAGVYTSPIELDYANFNVSVIIEDNKIKSVALKDFNEDMANMYPLVEPTMAYLNKEITKKQVLDITPFEEAPETFSILLNGIKEALNQN